MSNFFGMTVRKAENGSYQVKLTPEQIQSAKSKIETLMTGESLSLPHGVKVTVQG